MGDFLSEKDLAKLDFLKSMMWNLNLPKEIQENLVPQSIQGHMISGHGIFRGHIDPNTLIKDVYDTSCKDQKKGRKKREEQIKKVFNLVDRLTQGKTNKLTDENGQPILGFKPFEKYEIKSIDSALKGAAIMGCVDDAFWRANTINEYKNTLNNEPLKIGYGKEYLIDVKKLKRKGTSVENLAKKAHSKKEIRDFKKREIITNSKGKNIENLFIRHNEGLGCCDDLMLSSIGLIHGKDAMILAWAIDALDTYTKFVLNPKESGYDQILAKRIQDNHYKQTGEPLAKPEEIKEIIYLGAKENHPKINLSSSHRRFIQTEKGQNKPTINNHINYIEKGIRPKNYPLGFSKVSSDKFYDTLETRFKLHGKEHLLP